VITQSFFFTSTVNGYVVAKHPRVYENAQMEKCFSAFKENRYLTRVALTLWKDPGQDTGKDFALGRCSQTDRFNFGIVIFYQT